MTPRPRQPDSPWPHRVAVLLVCATFPLLWVGGLVTTTEAGMAVPDWPTTYGYNMFQYPWQTWLFGPWDLFIEHGHRMLGATVGLLCLTMVATLVCFDKRKWTWALGVATLLAVVFQGVLGGLRVIENQRTLAMIHGCFGPLVFAMTVALAVVTSGYWRDAAVPQTTAAGGKLQRLAVLTSALAYIQLVLGAQVRHLPASAGPDRFLAVMIFHLVFAAILAVHVALLVIRTWRSHRDEPLLLRPSLGLAALMTIQLVLGGAVWVVNYGWPAWLGDYRFSAAHVTLAGGLVQTHVTTLHVALGSLILVTSLMFAFRSLRLVRGLRSSTPAAAWMLEVAV